MRQRGKLLLLAIIVLSVVSIWILYSNIDQTIDDDGLAIKGFLDINNSNINTDREYILKVEMTKDKKCDTYIYPYIVGLSNVTFSKEDETDYYIPGSIGTDGVSVQLAIKEMINKQIIDENQKISLIGFDFPVETGQYKSKIYLDTLNEFKEIENPVLVCVCSEKRFGKMRYWTKIVEVKDNTKL